MPIQPIMLADVDVGGRPIVDDLGRPYVTDWETWPSSFYAVAPNHLGVWSPLLLEKFSYPTLGLIYNDNVTSFGNLFLTVMDGKLTWRLSLGQSGSTVATMDCPEDFSPVGEYTYYSGVNDGPFSVTL